MVRSTRSAAAAGATSPIGGSSRVGAASSPAKRAGGRAASTRGAASSVQVKSELVDADSKPPVKAEESTSAPTPVVNAHMDMAGLESHGAPIPDGMIAEALAGAVGSEVKTERAEVAEAKVLGSGRKRRATKKQEEALEGVVLESPKRRRVKKEESGDEAGKSEVDPSATPGKSKGKSTPKSKSKSRKTPGSAADTPSKRYGLTPGLTPFPDFPDPTPEACKEVADLLIAFHGQPQRTALTQAPSLTMSGCGEVPSVMDALIRTLLSAATTSANAGRAFQALVREYGVLEEGVGKGSVNWDKVRLGDRQRLEDTIRCGGLAKNKSTYIKAILDEVYAENIALRDAALAESQAAVKKEDPASDPNLTNVPGTSAAAPPLLSLDHLHALPTPEAMERLTAFPGIGVKTASCTLLFCMARDSFAVDTHVWRLCKWLGWTPQKATRDQTYKHCDVRIPNELKYDLHALFWKHGKYCGQCRMIPQGDNDISNKPCPIEHLVKRDNGRGVNSVKKERKSQNGTPKKGKGAGRRQRDSDDESEVDFTEESE